MTLNESIVEEAALTWFGELGCAQSYGAPQRHHKAFFEELGIG